MFGANAARLNLGAFFPVPLNTYDTVMWKLTIEDDEGTKTLLPLVRDEYHIGRDEKNSVRLTERNVSRHHASLKKVAGRTWHIIDHDSYNGCYVNGQRVAGDTKLSHSDVIQLGDYRIFVSNDSVAELDPSQGMGGVATSPSINVSADKPDRLVMLAGPEVGGEFPLNQDSVTIGRAEECAISINHPSVSRVHAEIKPLGAGRYEIFDRGSSNGLRVNGTDLRRALLEEGDLLELGDVKLRFVGRGQIYRPHSDMTQQLSAFTAKVPTAARAGALPSSNNNTSSKTGLLIGAGAAGVLVLVGLVALSLSSSDAGQTSKESPVVQVTEGDAKKPQEVAAKATPEAPVAEKTPEAAATAAAAEPEAIDLTDTAPAPTAKAALADGPGTTAKATSQSSGSTTAKKTAAAATTAAPTTNTPDPTSQDGEMKMRRLLEGKMNAGKATKDDLRMLKAICQHQSDSVCKSKAVAAMAKLD